MFGSWYDNRLQKARPIEELVAAFEKDGSIAVDAANNDAPSSRPSSGKPSAIRRSPMS
jgi:hypothetical protein